MVGPTSPTPSSITTSTRGTASCATRRRRSTSPGWGAKRGVVGTAERSDDPAHLGQRARCFVFDDGERIECGGRVVRSHDLSGLCTNRDGRHVVGDGVVQLPCEHLALAELDLVAVALARCDQVTNLRPQDCGEGEHERTADRIAEPGPVRGEARHHGGEHDRCADRSVAARCPAEQRVREEEQSRRRVELDRWVAERTGELIEPRDPDERDGGHRERMRTAPQQGARHAGDGKCSDRPPRGVDSNDAFDDRHHDHGAGDEPVSPHPARRVGHSRLGQQRREQCVGHAASVENRRRRTYRPEG